MVREEGFRACAKGAVSGAVGADVPAGLFGETDALLLPVGLDAARGFDEEEKSPVVFLDLDMLTPCCMSYQQLRSLPGHHVLGIRL